ncbi:cysteine--tRNA ligase [Rhodovulum sp. DZ06]|uniref:cysteine--tRNA ligase n=1 Tax=Rhodovulum sp. DZ06 TaxID=3425126 RepID=UPI003D33DFB6
MTDHPISLRNSLTGTKAAFIPLDWQDGSGIPEGERMVRMYVCGPTVYDRAHIGNARPAVAFDVLYRLLRHVYGESHVKYVRNITDVDDKIMARAEERGVPIEEITAETCAWYQEDMAAVGNLPPDAQPRATEYIAQMQAMIERLIASGHAYAAEGHVLFSVDSYGDYGKLSGRSVEDMIAGARVEVAPYKKNPMDFVLWKPSAPEQQGWDSPWGRGRPGWHIECSAMSEDALGADFDIHGGGSDLMFPHHENEIAQSCCATPGSGFARVWLHNGMIRIGGQKMSKSLGNFTTVYDLREHVPGEVIRLALLSTQYRGELDWTDRLAEDCEKALRRWRKVTEGATPGTPDPAVIAALADDLNTPKAIAELHRLAGEGDAPTLLASANLMGLLTPELGGWEKAPEAEGGDAARIQALLDERAAAKKAKDFARADAIRDGLAAAGVEVKDTAQGAEFTLSASFDAAKLEGL